MKKFIFLLVISLICQICVGQEHLSVDGIKLAKPSKEIIKSLEEKGLQKIAETEVTAVLVGTFWGYESSMVSIINHNDSCYVMGVVLPQTESAKALFGQYDAIRAKITSLFGVYGKESSNFSDSSVEKASIEEKYEAIRNKEGMLVTGFETESGLISVAISSNENLGVRVIATFVDYGAPTNPLELSNEKEEITTKADIDKKDGVPTRFKGVSLDRTVKEVLKDLKSKGCEET